VSPERERTRAANLVVHATGKACPRGHTGPRNTSSGGCYQCTADRSRKSRAMQVLGTLMVENFAAAGVQLAALQETRGSIEEAEGRAVAAALRAVA
jgi:hypothetical protein